MATEEEFYKLYKGEITLRFLPKSHTYSIDGDKKIGVTTITGIINKEALMLWPLNEALTYLKTALLGEAQADGGRLWSDKELKDVLDESAVAFRKKSLRGTDAGTACHEWLEKYFTAKQYGHALPAKLLPADLSRFGEDTDKTNDEYIRALDYNNILKAIEQMFEWLSQRDVEIIAVENILYSKKYDYCGKLDIILKIDGLVYLLDFKTSNPSREFEHGVYPENFSQLGGYDVAYTEEFPEQKIHGHGILNLSKKTGKFYAQLVEGDAEVKKDRDFFLFTLGTKRAMQDRTRLLSNKNKDRK